MHADRSRALLLLAAPLVLASASTGAALTCPAPLFRAYDLPAPRLPGGPAVAFVPAFPYVDPDVEPPATRLVLYAVRQPGERDSPVRAVKAAGARVEHHWAGDV